MTFVLHGKLIVASIDHSIISCIYTKLAQIQKISWTHKKCGKIAWQKNWGNHNEKILWSALVHVWKTIGLGLLNQRCMHDNMTRKLVPALYKDESFSKRAIKEQQLEKFVEGQKERAPIAFNLLNCSASKVVGWIGLLCFSVEFVSWLLIFRCLICFEMRRYWLEQLRDCDKLVCWLNAINWLFFPKNENGSKIFVNWLWFWAWFIRLIDRWQSKCGFKKFKSRLQLQSVVW